MTRSHAMIVRVGLALAWATWASAPAAEIRLRTQCETAAAVLTLGDVAEILGADPAETRQLTAIELGPTPPPGQQRFLRVREIQDLLWSQRVNLLTHQFSGYGLVAVTRADQSASAADKHLNSEESRRANAQVQQALNEYLRNRGAEAGKVDFELSDAVVRAVLAARTPITVRGGMPPWNRPQRFELSFAGPEGETHLPLEARLTASTAVVMPVRALPRGAVIRPEDVQLSQINFATAASRTMPCSLEEVVGRATTRAVPEGKPLETDALRSQPLVRRGDVVTVFAQAPGLKVKTMARARDDAGLGEQVVLDSLQERRPLLARVVGFQEAEALAAAPPQRLDRNTTRSRRPANHSSERTSR
jgi:flagella basal body P-ring formation protein FlgA